MSFLLPFLFAQLILPYLDARSAVLDFCKS